MINPGENISRLVSIADMSVEVYGRLSEKLLQAAQEMDVKAYSFFQKMLRVRLTG